MHRPFRGAGALGARHYSALFGESPPTKKIGPQSPQSDAGRNSKHDPGTIARNVDRDKSVPPPRRRDRA